MRFCFKALYKPVKLLISNGRKWKKMSLYQQSSHTRFSQKWYFGCYVGLTQTGLNKENLIFVQRMFYSRHQTSIFKAV
jgi:hypothetical protein